MLIRLATAADAPLLEALAHSIWNKVYPGIISRAQIDFMLQKMYNPGQIEAEIKSGYAWEIIEENGAPIGFLSTLLEKGNTLKVSKIYLEPAYHGRGYGQSLLKHIDEKARDGGANSVYLFVNRSNDRALKSYLRAGYEIVQTLDQEFGSFVLNDYKLAKPV